MTRLATLTPWRPGWWRLRLDEPEDHVELPAQSVDEAVELADAWLTARGLRALAWQREDPRRETLVAAVERG